jgi:hypothetical protein
MPLKVWRDYLQVQLGKKAPEPSSVAIAVLRGRCIVPFVDRFSLGTAATAPRGVHPLTVCVRGAEGAAPYGVGEGVRR